MVWSRAYDAAELYTLLGACGSDHTNFASSRCSGGGEMRDWAEGGGWWEVGGGWWL